MAQIYGPKIVTQGLVLSLDASDVNSYPAPIIVSVQAYSVYGGGLRSANYTVQFSDDNSTWTTAFTGIMSNNSSCGIITGTGVGSGTYGRHRYWRYVEGSAVVSHHPRVSRIDLIDINGTVRNLVTYTSDNCSDSGTYIVGTVSADLGGTTWYNISSAGSNGTLTNGPTFSIANGGSIAFDGTDDVVRLGSALVTGTGDFTLCSFVRRNQIGAGVVDFICGNYGVSNNGLELYYYINNIYLYAVGTYISSIATLSDTNWHFICATRASGTARIYIDGILDNTGALNVSIPGNNPFTLGNGHDYTSEALNGNIANCLVYNRALSAQEILQNYTAIKSRFNL
jgi:hypothetical protein